VRSIRTALTADSDEPKVLVGKAQSLIQVHVCEFTSYPLPYIIVDTVNCHAETQVCEHVWFEFVLLKIT